MVRGAEKQIPANLSVCVREVTGCLCSVPADRGDSGQRQTCAETELGWQRNEYREGDHRREAGSGKKSLYLDQLTSFFFFKQMCSSLKYVP